MKSMIAGFTAALAACCFLASPLAAQDRMPPIPADKLTEAQKKVVKEFAEGRGYEVRGPFTPLLRSPDLMTRAVGMSDYVRFKSVIAPRVAELVILVVAREWTQQYEWAAHYRNALKEGLKREIADAIGESRRPDAMAEDEGIAYDFATEILRSKRISDTTWGRAVAKFGDQGVVDLLGTVGYFNFLSIVMNGARTPLNDGSPGLLPRYPD
jgi:4-carboxymuconolactone decarboxylase